jgi:hypothetical protein
MIPNIYMGNNETARGISQQPSMGAIRSKSDQALLQEQVSSKIHLAIREMLNNKQERARQVTNSGTATVATLLCPGMSSRIGQAICSRQRD